MWHQAEVAAGARAFVDWSNLKEHIVKRLANVRMSKMWEALAPEREHAQWINVWCVLAPLRTYCPAEAAVERATSLRVVHH